MNYSLFSIDLGSYFVYIGIQWKFCIQPVLLPVIVLMIKVVDCMDSSIHYYGYYLVWISTGFMWVKLQWTCFSLNKSCFFLFFKVYSSISCSSMSRYIKQFTRCSRRWRWRWRWRRKRCKVRAYLLKKKSFNQIFSITF